MYKYVYVVCISMYKYATFVKLNSVYAWLVLSQANVSTCAFIINVFLF